MTTDSPIIETENLIKRFWRHEAVNGVTLTVPAKSMFALVGANGAGKTSILRMLVNLLRPDAGIARVCGVDSRKLRPADRLGIGYVSENQDIPSRITVAEYFEYLRALYPNWDRQLERELRVRFELPPERKLSALSHGMRMKVMLAGALGFRPRVLILDEPLSGLDPLIRDEVMSGLLEQADDTTIVISSHEIAEIETCATHVAFMAKGKLLFQESVESLKDRFREVRAVLAPDAPTVNYPDRWLNPRRQGASLHYVDSLFTDESECREYAASVLGGFQQIETGSISLRDIAKSLMRATRAETDV